MNWKIINKLRKLGLGIILVAVICGGSSCVSVKAWEKMYINDVEMELKAKKMAVFEMNAETYREGASGGNGGKAGGGCGCN